MKKTKDGRRKRNFILIWTMGIDGSWKRSHQSVCWLVFHGIWTLVVYSMLSPVYIYVLPSISFQTFSVQAFKIVIDTWQFSILLLYILWDDWPIFMISTSNEQLQQQLEYTQLKPDCHSWWISKMQSGRKEERYAIKFCFKLGKKVHRNVWNATDCFLAILHESSISFWMA